MGGSVASAVCGGETIGNNSDNVSECRESTQMYAEHMEMSKRTKRAHGVHDQVDLCVLDACGGDGVCARTHSSCSTLSGMCPLTRAATNDTVNATTLTVTCSAT